MYQFNLHRKIASDRLETSHFLYQCGKVMFAVGAVALTALNLIESADATELEVIDLQTSATFSNTNLRERLRTERKSREFISKLRSLRDNPHTSQTNLVITEIPHRSLFTSPGNNLSYSASELRKTSLPLPTTHRNTFQKSTGIIGNWVFGNVALRVAKPASLVVEWTGQDLGVGVSVTPFANLPLVITPAVRDITGAGDGARFVIGTGFSFQF